METCMFIYFVDVFRKRVASGPASNITSPLSTSNTALIICSASAYKTKNVGENKYGTLDKKGESESDKYIHCWVTSPHLSHRDRPEDKVFKTPRCCSNSKPNVINREKTQFSYPTFAK